MPPVNWISTVYHGLPQDLERLCNHKMHADNRKVGCLLHSRGFKHRRRTTLRIGSFVDDDNGDDEPGSPPPQWAADGGLPPTPKATTSSAWRWDHGWASEAKSGRAGLQSRQGADVLRHTVVRGHNDLVSVPISEPGKQLEESRERPLFIVYRLQSRNVFDEHIFRKICPYKAMEFSQKILASVNPAVRPALLREWLTRRAGTEDDGAPPLAGADMRRDILDPRSVSTPTCTRHDFCLPIFRPGSRVSRYRGLSRFQHIPAPAGLGGIQAARGG
jgi:hypothetical protein